MKPLLVIPVIVMLFAAGQKRQQDSVRMDPVRPEKHFTIYAYPQSEPVDTVQTGHSGKIFIDAMIVL